MNGPVKVCVGSLREGFLQLYNTLRPLRSSSIVKINQRLAIDLLVQGGELISYVFKRHNDIVKSYKFT